ncbi:hypothetical protein [Oceanisphaera sp. IT1-181]|uniref:hypothetical protein n=1 Tax=Oceanisphaera sp. IT1-181 TaxID=3081199 RepID=UPI0029CA83B6|nr:hypothetical protein [Oceanisphaera sp. IT1-181]
MHETNADHEDRDDDEETNIGCEDCGCHGVFYYTKGRGFLCDRCLNYEEHER